MVFKVKRGKCLYCGRTFALNKAGRVRRHNQRGSRRPPAEAQPALVLCGGSGQIPG